MGYISEVAIVIKTEDAIELFSKAIERTVNMNDSKSYCLPILLEGFYGGRGTPFTMYNESTEEWIKKAKKIISELSYSNKVLFFWSYVKWYYDDVEHFIMPFVKNLSYFQYLRVGEEQGDIEKAYRGIDYPNIYAECHINTDYALD